MNYSFIELASFIKSHLVAMSTAMRDNRSSSDVVESEKPGTPVYTEVEIGEKKVPVLVQNEGLGYQFTPDELPKRYYTSLYFMGTMLACGSAFAAVSFQAAWQLMMIMGTNTNDRVSVALP